MVWTSSDFPALLQSGEPAINAIWKFSERYDLPIYGFGHCEGSNDIFYLFEQLTIEEVEYDFFGRSREHPAMVARENDRAGRVVFSLALGEQFERV